MDKSTVQDPISRLQYEAIRANEAASCAALAREWAVEAIGRDYPLYLSRAGPAVVGAWYVVRDGVRHRATADQTRILDRLGQHGVHAIGPIYASAS